MRMSVDTLRIVACFVCKGSCSISSFPLFTREHVHTLAEGEGCMHAHW